MRGTRPPSMADVAERAGVSHQTVSRVLNGHAYVRPDTRDRVQAAIDELGYRRNQAARALVTARSATIGVLTAGTTHYGPTSTVLAVEAAARAEGYYVSVGSLSGAGSARPVFEQLMNQGVDGVVVVAPLDEVAHLMDDVASAVPVVVVAARPDIPEQSPIRYVAVDQVGGAMLATEHLLGLGHERIVHVAGPDGWYDAAQRAEGHRRLLAEQGLEPRLVAAGGWSARRGYDAGMRLAAELRTAGGPTAVFAANDYLAMGLLRAFWERGVRVPEDVSLVGFDDIDGSGFLVPALTTVRQPFAAVGEAAIHALLDHWSADPSQDAGGLVALIAPELVVRDSTAAPRA
ncbi:LacI family transcriptional regulator [Microbacterium paludicola]|uniref:LacI family transcriptional regulator n=1 Tax=Microbacterium paludicola TaxID=300019 RepID=A0A4Y9FZQ0_9MICO|nr:LacI family DNA-binding transcriptional regulator [Microbacterium paludicola]MBF0815220.1 LacI family DNA-binding transcriptional regulator [Microbacterium paludicola]TFU34097.1 LacI family transcriptional regulator [Microbacterium paludicola]